MVLLVSLAFFAAAILPGACLNDIDGFYHYTIARLIGEGRPWVGIDWLPFTVLGEDGPDHQWLFHVLIAPLTWLGRDLIDLKLAAVILATLTPVVLYVLLRRWSVPSAWLFALLALFGGVTVAWRFEMMRVQNLAVVLICLFVHMLIRRQLVSMLVLTWFFFNAYHGAVLIVPIFFCFLAGRWLQTGYFDSRALIVFLAAIVLALVVNPWFPKNIEYLLFHTLSKTQSHFAAINGTEWFRYPLKDFLFNNALLHGLLLVMLLATAKDFVRKRVSFREIPSDTALFVVLSLAMFVVTLSGVRFIEYYAPFAAISSGLLLRDIYSRQGANTTSINLPSERVRLCLAGFVVALMLVCMGTNLSRTRAQQIFDITTYKSLADYLAENVPKGSLIFNTAYSDFPQVLWYTTDYPMANGLDVNFLAYGDPGRFRLWLDVTQFYRFDSPDLVSNIAHSFNTRWILVHKADEPLARYLADSHEAALRFSYQNGWLFEIEPDQKEHD